MSGRPAMRREVAEKLMVADPRIAKRISDLIIEIGDRL
jgi:hypothetical protein